MSESPIMNEIEDQCMDHILSAMNIIIGTWELDKDASNLGIELASAVHTMQSFVIQHMLQRLAPGYWGDWYDSLPRGKS